MKFYNKISSSFSKTTYYVGVCVLWLILGLLMGGIGGVVGTLFSKTLDLSVSLYSKHSFLLFFLPIAGIIINFIYTSCHTVGSNTNTVFETVRDEREVSLLLAPAVFAATVLTQLCGGSAGREGAALQIGGSLAALVGRVVRIGEKQRHILTMCGMSALFSALFGTPAGACIFAVEVASVGRIYTAALFPCMISSVTAYSIAMALGVRPEHFAVGEIPMFTLATVARVVLIAIIVTLVAILFCSTMHHTHSIFKRIIKNRYLRVTLGGAIIILLTLLLGNTDYNGSGSHIIEGIFDGHSIRPEAFLLKIIFTAITMGSGYKGGEIVPTLFIGATLGGFAASLIDLSVPFGAALGMAALFGGVTNCPLTAIVISVELFGGEGIIFYLIAILAVHLLSGRHSLYTGQRMLFSKLDDELIDNDCS